MTENKKRHNRFATTSKLGYFGINRTKNKIFYLIHTCKPENNLKRDDPGCKICQKNFRLDIANALFCYFIKMWRINLFI